MTYTITHNGRWISWNTLLSNNRWQRAKIIKEWKPLYQAMFITAGIKPMNEFKITVRYWSKIDADNCCFKYIIDQLRADKLVTNDDKRFFKGITTIPDPSLKHNTYIIEVIDTEKARINVNNANNRE